MFRRPEARCHFTGLKWCGQGRAPAGGTRGQCVLGSSSSGSRAFLGRGRSRGLLSHHIPRRLPPVRTQSHLTAHLGNLAILTCSHPHSPCCHRRGQSQVLGCGQAAFGTNVSPSQEGGLLGGRTSQGAGREGVRPAGNCWVGPCGPVEEAPCAGVWHTDRGLQTTQC